MMVTKNGIIKMVWLLPAMLSFLLLSGCGNDNEVSYQGYVEGEARYLASPYSGNLIKRYVHRGQKVKKGELLYQLDTAPQSFDVEASEANQRQAINIFKDLELPKRKPVIESIQSQIEQVDSQLELADIRVKRYKKLYEQNATSKDVLDEVLTREEELLNRKAELIANLALAKLGSRPMQIEAQAAKVSALDAAIKVSKWQLAQKTVKAPLDGVIQDTFYKEGEFVGAQKPVLSLLSSIDIKIQFFIPVEALATLKVNQKVQFSCFGCDTSYTATITYISPDAEYIPPLVYSRENSDKLVFRVKALPENPELFKPGQPVMITGIVHDKTNNH